VDEDPTLTMAAFRASETYIALARRLHMGETSIA